MFSHTTLCLYSCFVPRGCGIENFFYRSVSCLRISYRSELINILGPVVGSLVYSIGGYIAPFAVFGTLALLLVPVIGCLLKSKVSLNKGPKKQTLVVEAGDNQ